MAKSDATQNDDGLTTQASPYSVTETLDRASAVLERRGVRIFARIDHAAAAKDAELALADEQVLIFGNPSAGTLLMQDNPRVG